jgi:hypothetical protein
MPAQKENRSKEQFTWPAKDVTKDDPVSEILPSLTISSNALESTERELTLVKEAEQAQFVAQLVEKDDITEEHITEELIAHLRHGLDVALPKPIGSLVGGKRSPAFRRLQDQAEELSQVSTRVHREVEAFLLKHGKHIAMSQSGTQQKRHGVYVSTGETFKSRIPHITLLYFIFCCLLLVPMLEATNHGFESERDESSLSSIKNKVHSKSESTLPRQPMLIEEGRVLTQVSGSLNAPKVPLQPCPGMSGAVSVYLSAPSPPSLPPFTHQDAA